MNKYKYLPIILFFFLSTFQLVHTQDWVAINIPKYSLYQSLTVTKSGEIIFGAYENNKLKTYGSKDMGITWHSLDSLLPANTITGIASDKRGYLYTSSSKKIYRRKENSTTWDTIPKHLDTYFLITGLGTGIHGDVFAEIQNSGTYTTPDLSRTIDDGESWQDLIRGPYATHPNGMILNSGCYHFNLNFCYWKHSTNNGNSWDTTILLGSSTNITAYAIDPQEIVYMAKQDSGIFQSTQRGNWGTWINKNTGLTNLNVNILVSDDFCNVYAGTSTGIYRSTNKGELWSPYNLGLASLSIKKLFFGNDEHLYTLAGDTLYRSTESVLSAGILSNNSSNLFILSQNYPNPFNPTTTIAFQIKNNEWVTLKIYDILGKEIAIIVDEKLSPGSYSKAWNASVFPSGVYYYRLQTGNFSEVKKLLLVQ